MGPKMRVYLSDESRVHVIQVMHQGVDLWYLGEIRLASPWETAKHEVVILPLLMAWFSGTPLGPLGKIQFMIAAMGNVAAKEALVRQL